MATVLVVEDQPETRRPLARLLKLEGYNVLTAADAYSAGAHVRNDHPDLILLDIGIPPMDGLTLLMLIRDDPKTREIPVVLVTGIADEHTRSRAESLGVKEYLVKSQFDTDDLLRVVRKYAGQGTPQ